jgi:PAS domain S-box-containing protein
MHSDLTDSQEPSADDRQIDLILADAAQRLRSVVETAVDGIITISEHGIIDSINPAGAQMFGYAPEELLGRNVSMLMPQPHASAHDGYLAAYLQTGRASIIGVGRELTAKRRDGSLFPMRLAVSEMALSGKRCFTGIVSDLTLRRQLERQVLESAAAEQRRIGQDLHDGMCQQLAAAGFSLEMLKRKAERGSPVEPAQFQKIQQLLQDAVGQLRQLAHGLQPVSFRVGGLPEALKHLAEATSDRFHIHCRARCSPGADIEDETTADHLYRIAQEATGNAIKHGKANEVKIQLGPWPVAGMSLFVLDNGQGFGSTNLHRPHDGASSTGMGLKIMKYRADAIGADFRIHRRRRRHGAIVQCTLPPAPPVEPAARPW